MSTLLSGWILSIAGVVCLSVVVELILPNGQMNRYIKGIFSFIIILVIIAPIPKLVKLKINVDDIFTTPDITMQDSYLEQVNHDKLMALQESISTQVKKAGYDNVTVSISADIFASNMEIKGVFVDLSLLVITSAAKHRDIVSIRQEIVNIIQNHIKLKEERITFNE